MVTGRSVLYPYPPLRTTNYDGYNTNYDVIPGIAFRMVVEKGSRDLLLLLLYPLLSI